MIDLVLMGVVFVLFIAGVFLAALSTTCWGWCLCVLDARYWSPWMWLGLCLALVEIMLLFRFWPDNNNKGTDS